MSTETFDTLYINITFKSKTISIFSIYNSPKNSYLQIEKHLIQLLDKEIITSNNLIWCMCRMLTTCLISGTSIFLWSLP